RKLFYFQLPAVFLLEYRRDSQIVSGALESSGGRADRAVRASAFLSATLFLLLFPGPPASEAGGRGRLHRHSARGIITLLEFHGVAGPRVLVALFRGRFTFLPGTGTDSTAVRGAPRVAVIPERSR